MRIIIIVAIIAGALWFYFIGGRTLDEQQVKNAYASISIAADKKSATAHITSEIRIGTEKRLFLKINEVQTDTLKREWGKTQFVATEGTIRMGR